MEKKQKIAKLWPASVIKIAFKTNRQTNKQKIISDRKLFLQHNICSAQTINGNDEFTFILNSTGRRHE